MKENYFDHFIGWLIMNEGYSFSWISRKLSIIYQQYLKENFLPYKILKNKHLCCYLIFLFENMKSRDFSNRVLLKCKDGQSCTKVHEALHGSAGLPTIERWCKLIRKVGRITLLKSTGRRRTVSTEANIWKVKHRHDHYEFFRIVKSRPILRISHTSA